jgi:hypothetical protein
MATVYQAPLPSFKGAFACVGSALHALSVRLLASLRAQIDVNSSAVPSSPRLIRTNGVPSAWKPRCAMTTPASSLVSVMLASARNWATSCDVSVFMYLGGLTG